MGWYYGLLINASFEYRVHQSSSLHDKCSIFVKVRSFVSAMEYARVSELSLSRVFSRLFDGIGAFTTL